MNWNSLSVFRWWGLSLRSNVGLSLMLIQKFQIQKYHSYKVIIFLCVFALNVYDEIIWNTLDEEHETKNEN